MKKNILFFGIVGIAALLNGCMMWMHGDHGAQDHRFAKTVVKELVDKDLALSLTAPPPLTGQEALLVVRVNRIKDDAPITGASVTFEIKKEGRHGEGHAEHLSAVVAERAAEEVAGTGEYRLRFVFDQPGPYRITARVKTADKDQAGTQSVSLTQEVGGHGEHDGNLPPTSWMIIGGIGMAFMMALKFGLLVL
jgi:hypothetical protein